MNEELTFSSLFLFMTHTQRIQEVKNHLHHENLHLGFRMLTDLVLDTMDMKHFKSCIQLAEWKEDHPEEDKKWVQKAQQLLQELSFPPFSENSKPILEAKDLVKTYGGRSFELGPISLSIYPGQLVGLVGENGNGKTTLLRMLSQDLSLSTGSISYSHHPNTNEYDLRTKLVYIPQRTPKWFGKVKDNLKLTATHYGISPSENEYWVLMMMIRFGLWKFRNYRWNELSSGYKMRFELARTFLRKPKLLLLDEPLANLDILSQQLILEDLKLLGKSLTHPLGIVLSSQQLYEVEKVSDEVVFLKDGKPSSFNALKENTNHSDSKLVIELDIENTKEDLIAALQGIQVTEIKKLGSNYYIEMNHVTINEFMKAITAAELKVRYFRDISHSTRRFFNA